MYHSITIGDKNTWDDWHLIPTSRPAFSPPTVKENFIEIPGRDGGVDLTSVLTGEPLYNNRVGSFEFAVEPGHERWDILYSRILNYLQGKIFPAVLEDDPSYYYEGRFTVNSWESDQAYSRIVIDYDVRPYKRELIGSLDDWLWDPFDFEVGIIRSHANLEIDGSRDVTIEGLSMKIRPTFIVSGDVSVSFQGNTYQLQEGTNKIAAITVGKGTNILSFTGNGVVSIDYRGGSL